MTVNRTSRVVIVGVDELGRNCQHLDNHLRSKLGGIVKAGADIIRDEARRRAPFKTGALREGIISQITWDKNKSKAFAGTAMDTAKNDVFVKFTKDGKRYYYPASQEYGVHGEHARPFMRPAFDSKRAAVRNEIKQRFLAELGRGVK